MATNTAGILLHMEFSEETNINSPERKNLLLVNTGSVSNILKKGFAEENRKGSGRGQECMEKHCGGIIAQFECVSSAEGTELKSGARGGLTCIVIGNN